MSAAVKQEVKKGQVADKIEEEVVVDEDEVFLSLVVNVFGTVGSGGACKLCRVQVVKTGRFLFRYIWGPVKEGDYVQLRDCVRESRKTSSHS